MERLQTLLSVMCTEYKHRADYAQIRAGKEKNAINIMNVVFISFVTETVQ